jgi:hypothetical protein
LEECGGDRPRRRGRVDRGEEAAEERLGLPRPFLPEPKRPGGERVGVRVAAREAERGRLDHRERAQELGMPRGCEERDHAAVRMPDEMRPRLDVSLEPHRLLLEVDPLDVRAGREAAPVRDHELEALRERALPCPGHVAVDDAAVDEEHAGTADPAILRDDTK